MEVSVCFQVFVSALFAVSAAAKLSKLSSFRDTLRQLRITPLWARNVAVAIPLLELAVCVLLLFPITLRYGAVLALLLLSSFGWAAWRAKGRIVTYQWFGGLLSERFGTGLHTRHLILFLLNIYLLVAPFSSKLVSASFIEVTAVVFSSLGIVAVYALGLTLRQYHRLYQE
ncbi:methylamine utilization protein MauE [Fontibacillus phaseoli]|uniref:Methylamine utilization protein MauE n=1 Tax=Fontibacillus phaseoli TaxID=1416533 RepID=A0A369BEZ9_9BACL|nr:methylamine utilization protein MauE [Fontibacillus phaseoli]